MLLNHASGIIKFMLYHHGPVLKELVAFCFRIDKYKKKVWLNVNINKQGK